MDNNELLMDILVLLIKEPIFLHKTKLTECYSSFISVYSNNDFRHSYFEISQYLEKLIPEQRDLLEMNIDYLIQYVYEEHPTSDVLKKLMKLYDHISLERLRLARMDEVNYIAEKSQKSMDDLMEEVALAKNESKEAIIKINGTHSDTITILGIFAGLVIGFATSFQLLAQSFTNLNDIYFYKIISYLAFIGIILFDCIFLLMFAVARISNRSLAFSCKYDDCTRCNKKGKWICKISIWKIYKKYPYVILYNILMIAVIAFCVWWERNHYI